MQLALPSIEQALNRKLRLPPCIPPFNKTGYRLFTALWIAVFVLAIAGPVAGFYLRYTEPANNSQLLLGSRAGFAVSPGDATLIRFPVGPQPASSHIVAGDRITAIYGLTLPKSMNVNEAALAQHADDPAYIALGNLLFGTDQSEVPLTLRDPDGTVRQVSVTTGEQHIDAGARSLGVSPRLLSFIDLLHVLAYPFLFWAAWLLHRRNARDVVSSILSIAVLLTIAAEQPSFVFLEHVRVPRFVNVAILDLGNVLLLAGILLFPHGSLSWRRVVAITLLPVLFFLHGATYQALFLFFMLVAVLSLVRCVRATSSPDERQQIRWALFGIGGYSVLRCVSIAADFLKYSTHSFGQQLLVETSAGVAFAVAVLVLQLGLLIALVRYRLYDAEVVIGRSVNYALLTLGVAAVFAAVGDALKQIVYNYSGNTNNEGPILFAAALATIMVNPIQERVQRWSQRKFQKNLFLLRDDLPEVLRDMRATASLGEMVDEMLRRVESGVRSVRAAAIVGGRVLRCRGVSQEEVETWRNSTFAEPGQKGLCEESDRFFPIRVPLVPGSGDEAPVGYLLVGPRPDGSIPSRDEQKALSEVSEPIARAIRTVILREEREQEVAQLIAAQAARIDALEAAVSGRSLARSPSPRTA